MPAYIITCPICRKQYKMVPKDPSTLAQKSFTCPACRYSSPFSTLIKGLPTSGSAAAAVSTPPSPNKTKVRGGSGAQSRAYLTVSSTGAKFVLTQGVYILGRRSSDSTATLQLAPDISMSRQHARFALQMVGGKLMAQIIGLKTNNPILINGKVYAQGQPYTLKSGDILQLGNTVVTYSV